MSLPQISPSKLTTYLACPVKYRWSYVDGRARIYRRARPAFSFGTSLHRALESFAKDEGVPTAEAIAAELEQSWISAGYRDADEMQEAFGEGKQILEDFVSAGLLREPGSKTLQLEANLSYDFEKFRLTGRVDRIDELADGTLEIIDYKTSRSSLSPADVEANIALSCYQFLLKQENPDRRVQARLISLTNQATAAWEMPEDTMAQFQEDVRVLGEWILKEDYADLLPKVKAICKSCDFLPLCRKHEEFAWAEPAGIGAGTL
jgi:CRISPR/Cas system-associated exonuclease Cas4 (RecB family)